MDKEEAALVGVDRIVEDLASFRRLALLMGEPGMLHMPPSDEVMEKITTAMTTRDVEPIIEAMHKAIGDCSVDRIMFDSLAYLDQPREYRYAGSKASTLLARRSTRAMIGIAAMERATKELYAIPPVEVIEKVRRERTPQTATFKDGGAPRAYTERVGPPGVRSVNRKAKAKNRAKNKAARKNRHG